MLSAGVQRKMVLLATAATWLVGCAAGDELALSGDQLEPAQEPPPFTVGDERRWVPSRESRGLINRSTSDGYYEGFLVCVIPEEFAGVSCGQSSTVERGTRFTTEASAEVNLGKAGKIGVKVSTMYITSQSHTINSGPCETCWATLCFNVRMRRWHSPATYVPPSTGMYNPLATGTTYPARTWYEAETYGERIWNPTCREELLCPGCMDPLSSTDAVSDSDRGPNGELLTNPRFGATRVLSGPVTPVRSFSFQMDPQSAGWDAVTPAERCALVLDRDLAVQSGGPIDTLNVTDVDGSVRAYDGDERFGCPSTEELQAFFATGSTALAQPVTGSIGTQDDTESVDWMTASDLPIDTTPLTYTPIGSGSGTGSYGSGTGTGSYGSGTGSGSYGSGTGSGSYGSGTGS